jgi:hypothetical protein
LAAQQQPDHGSAAGAEQPADDQPRAGPGVLRQQADQRRAERRRAEEDQDVERHHPAPHLLAGGQLDGGVRGRRERQHRGAGRHE